MKENLFLGLTFQQFADLNAIGIILLTLFSIIFFLFFFYKDKIKDKIKNKIVSKFLNTIFDNIKYLDIVRVLFLILLIAVVGANVYERVYGDLPCEYCWYQRILIYPMLFLTLAESFFMTKVVHKFLSVFAVLTVILASYHYYYHFQRYVMDNALSLPCSSNPLVPNCTEAGVVSFGFITMPLLSALMAFSIILILTVLYKIKR